MIFNCETCGKTFTQNIYLKQHKRTHFRRMEIGKYDCKFCEKTYTSNQKLGNHIEKHHPCVKDFNCKSCGQQSQRNPSKL